MKEWAAIAAHKQYSLKVNWDMQETENEKEKKERKKTILDVLYIWTFLGEELHMPIR